MGKLKVSKFLLANGEVEFNLMDADGVRDVTIHPWDRGKGRREVYIAVDGGEFMNIVVSRKKFVKGLLAVFPELQLKKEG